MCFSQSSAQVSFGTPACPLAGPSEGPAYSLPGFTQVSGSNRLVWAGCNILHNGTPLVTGTATATLGGEAMSQAASLNLGNNSNRSIVDFYILEADLPADGARDLVVTLGNSEADTRVKCSIVQINNVAQQAPEIMGSFGPAAAQAGPATLNPVTVGAAITYHLMNDADRTSTIAVGGGLSLACASVNGGIAGRGISGTMAAAAPSETPLSTWTANTTSRAIGLSWPEFVAATPAPRYAPSVVQGHWPGRYEIQAQALPDGVEDEAYAAAPLTPLNGQTPYTWAVIAGALPAGLTLNADTGAISGTPTTTGTHSFTVSVSDLGSGEAYRAFSITVVPAAGDSLTFYEDVEDGNIAELLTPGGSSATSNGFMEGESELAKTSAADTVWFDNINKPEVYLGFDLYRDGAAAPDTDRDEVLIGLGSGGEELFSIRIETDWDRFAKTPGQTDLGGRGFSLCGDSLAAGTSNYLEFHYAKGTGSDALFRARCDGGPISTFSAGTATTNVDRIIFRNHNDDAAQDFFFDRIEAKDDDWPGRGPLVADPPPPPPDPSEALWITNFTPVRTHYVANVSCGGNGTIGSPECPSTAVSTSHSQCGDLHVFRAGNYYDTVGTSFNEECTQSNPIVWKGYVDPATGQPERATFKGEVVSNGAWNWFVNLEIVGNTAGTPGVNNPGTSDKAIEFEDAGVRAINNVLHDQHTGSVIGVWDKGPGQVVYGNILYNPGAYHMYTQNTFNASGWKYVIQNFFIDPVSHQTSQMLNGYTEGGFVQGYHVEKNFFAGMSEPFTRIQISSLSSNPVLKIKLHDNWYVNFARNGKSVHFPQRQPVQFEVTDNYFARTNFVMESYWGNAGTHASNIFTGNEIYDPPGGNHIMNLTTAGTAGTDGTQKFPDADEWDNNIYGGTFRAQIWCNSTNSGHSTLTQWRDRSDNCRVTPDGGGNANGFDLSSTNPANPTTPKIRVLRNEYQCPNCVFRDQARGNIYVVNWGNGTSNISVDISSIVSPGKTYVVRYARDFYGTAAASGTCPGSGACHASMAARRMSSLGTGAYELAYVITGQP